MTRFPNKRWILFGVLLLVVLNGCILAPAIESFSHLGVTRGDRVALLPKSIKDFQDALYWGQPNDAIGLVRNDKRSEFSNHFKNLRRSERVMDSTVESVDFSEDAYAAEAEILVRFIDKKHTTNVVSQRSERQQWEFSMSDGWQIVSRDDLSEQQAS